MSKPDRRLEIVRDAYELATETALVLIEERARKILLRHPSWDEFVMSMGTWCFFDKKGAIHDRDDEATASVAEIIGEWDMYLKLTGHPMRFTARGPKIVDW